MGLRWRGVMGTALAAAVLSQAVGCSLPGRIAEPDGHRFTFRRGIPGSSVRGEPVEAWILPGDGPTVLVVGGMHGDEPSSADVVAALRDHLVRNERARARRKVVLLPRANPDGLAAGTRTNARGVDLNRNLPARNFRPGRGGGPRPASEPESTALLAAIEEHDPMCVISVHAPLSCVDPDGDFRSVRLARRLAAVSGLPLHDLPSQPGSLGSYVSLELGRIMVTYELEGRSLGGGEAGEQRLLHHVRALAFAVREAGR